MPFVQIYLLEGREENTKREIIEKVTGALKDATDLPSENIHVVLIELPNTNLGTGGKSVKDMGR